MEIKKPSTESEVGGFVIVMLKAVALLALWSGLAYMASISSTY